MHTTKFILSILCAHILLSGCAKEETTAEIKPPQPAENQQATNESPSKPDIRDEKTSAPENTQVSTKSQPVPNLPDLPLMLQRVTFLQPLQLDLPVEEFLALKVGSTAFPEFIQPWMGITSDDKAFLALPTSLNHNWLQNLSKFPTNTWVQQEWGAVFISKDWLVFSQQSAQQAAQTWHQEFASTPLSPMGNLNQVVSWLNTPASTIFLSPQYSANNQWIMQPPWKQGTKQELSLSDPYFLLKWQDSFEVWSYFISLAEESNTETLPYSPKMLQSTLSMDYESRLMDSEMVSSAAQSLLKGQEGYITRNENSTLLHLFTTKPERTAHFLCFLLLQAGASAESYTQDIFLPVYEGTWLGEPWEISFHDNQVLVLWGKNATHYQATTNSAPSFINISNSPATSWLPEDLPCFISLTPIDSRVQIKVSFQNPATSNQP